MFVVADPGRGRWGCLPPGGMHQKVKKNFVTLPDFTMVSDIGRGLNWTKMMSIFVTRVSKSKSSLRDVWPEPFLHQYKINLICPHRSRS